MPNDLNSRTPCTPEQIATIFNISKKELTAMRKKREGPDYVIGEHGEVRYGWWNIFD